MTTIAYKNGIIAADTLVTANDCAVDYETKIHKVGKQFVIACAGNMFAGYKIRDAIASGQDFKNLDIPTLKRENFSCFISDYKNLYYLDNEFYPQKLNKKKAHALGSGVEYALGAMEAGCSAVEAVKIGCKFDVRSGGNVQKVILWDNSGR